MKRARKWGPWTSNMRRLPDDLLGCTLVAFVNRVYSVRVYRTRNSEIAIPEVGCGLMMSVTCRDTGPIRGAHWLELQRIKREIGFGEFWACEWYPPESEVKDPAHVYYLTLWPRGHAIPESCNLEAPDSHDPASDADALFADAKKSFEGGV